MEKIKLYEVHFEPIYPVGGCLVVKAYNIDGAKRIASNTIKHTSVFEIEEIDIDNPGVIIYMSGDH